MRECGYTQSVDKAFRLVEINAMNTYLTHSNIEIKAKDDFTRGFKRKCNDLNLMPVAHQRVGHFSVVTVRSHNNTRSLVIGRIFDTDGSEHRLERTSQFWDRMKRDRLSQLTYVLDMIEGHPLADAVTDDIVSEFRALNQ